MADHDPKRAGSSGTFPKRPAFEADDDPLVELARIVSDDGAFYSGRRTVAEPRRIEPSVDRDSFSADLEAELMQELEASFQTPLRAPSRTAAEQARPAPRIEPTMPSRPAIVPAQPESASAPPPQQSRPAPVRQEPGFQTPPAPPSRPAPPASFTERLAASRAAGAAEPTSLRPTFADHRPVAPERPRVAPPVEESPAAPVYAQPRASEPAPSQDSPFERPAYSSTESPPARAYDPAPPARPAVDEQWASGDAAATFGRGTHAAAPYQPEPTPAETDFDFGPFETEPAPVSYAPFAPDEIMSEPVETEPAFSDQPGRAPQDDVFEALEAELSGLGEVDQGREDRHFDLPRIDDFDAEDNTAWGGRRTLREDHSRAVRQGPDEDVWVERASDPEQEIPVAYSSADETDYSSIRHEEPSFRPAEFKPKVTDDPIDPYLGQPAADWDYEEESPRDEPMRSEPVAPPPPPRGGSASRVERVAPQKKSRTGLMLVGAVAGVAVLGGVVAAMIGGEEDVASGPPPVIRAEDGAVKIAPEAPRETAEQQDAPGAAVYDRVAGEPAEPAGELVDNSEEPREVARIVLPPSNSEPASGAPAAEPADPSGKAQERVDGEEDTRIGARRVRTFVVRPDGTIVPASEAGDAPAATAAPAQADPVPGAGGEPLEPSPVRTTTITDPVAQDIPVEAPGNNQPGPAPAGESTGLAALQEAPVGAPGGVPRSRPAQSGETAGDLQLRDAPAEDPAAPDMLASAPAVAPPAAAPAAQPTPAAAPPAAEVAASSSAPGFRVQLSSQRTEEQAMASFGDLQSRFPSVLGSYGPDIQRADLGEKGIYYRVRVGPMQTREAAVEVCEALQAAGGSCFVTE